MLFYGERWNVSDPEGYSFEGSGSHIHIVSISYVYSLLVSRVALSCRVILLLLALEIVILHRA